MVVAPSSQNNCKPGAPVPYRRRKEVLGTILVDCEAPISPEQIEVLRLNLQHVSKKLRAVRDQSKVQNGDRDRNQRHGE